MQPPTTMLSSQTGRSLPLPCGSAHKPNFAAYQRWLKRLIDIVGATVFLVVLSPVWLATAVAVAVVSGRPILFRDQRAGLDGRPFTLWKFRSMRVATGPDGASLPDGERLTAFGRFLRQTSLDELPQLLCVLTGSMSLVGPRPLPMRYVPRYSPRQATRLLVRPGLTGWAQIHGRNEVEWNRRLALDADYVERLRHPGGLLLDLRILWKTAALVFVQAITGRGIAAPGAATMREFSGEPDRRRAERALSHP